jgi:hypothetical protein
MRAPIPTDTKVVPPPKPAGPSARECLDVRSVGPQDLDAAAGPPEVDDRGERAFSLGDHIGPLVSDRWEGNPWLGGFADDLERAAAEPRPRR